MERLWKGRTARWGRLGTVLTEVRESQERMELNQEAMLNLLRDIKAAGNTPTPPA